MLYLFTRHLRSVYVLARHLLPPLLICCSLHVTQKKIALPFEVNGWVVATWTLKPFRAMTRILTGYTVTGFQAKVNSITTYWWLHIATLHCFAVAFAFSKQHIDWIPRGVTDV